MAVARHQHEADRPLRAGDRQGDAGEVELVSERGVAQDQIVGLVVEPDVGLERGDQRGRNGSGRQHQHVER